MTQMSLTNPEQEVLSGTIQRFFSQNPDTGWGAGVLAVAKGGRDGSPTASVAGQGLGLRNVGEDVILVGSWSKHPTYGDQFQVERVQYEATPQTVGFSALGPTTPLPNLFLAGAWTGAFGQTAALRSGVRAAGLAEGYLAEAIPARA